MEEKELTPEEIQAQELAEAAQAKEDAFWEATNAKASSIASATGKRVVPIVIQDIDTPGEYVVGYMYRPDLDTQLKLSDKGQEFASGFSYLAGSAVLESLLIKAESDKRINTETDQGELYWKGAIIALFEFVKGARAVIKKK